MHVLKQKCRIVWNGFGPKMRGWVKETQRLQISSQNWNLLYVLVVNLCIYSTWYELFE